MRVVFVGGTGPVGRASLPHLLAADHDVAVAHSGAHEPPVADDAEHLHGSRNDLLALGGAVERWRPEVVVDTFAGGASAAKARELGALAQRAGVAQVVAVSSIDVYRHSAAAGVGGFPPTELPLDPLPLHEDRSPLRTEPMPFTPHHDNVAMEAALTEAAPRVTILRPGAIYGPAFHAAVLREWFLVAKALHGDRTLPFPHGGTQLFHRVALERVGRAVAAAVDHAPQGTWACNVADPYDWTYGGLAQLVAQQLGHTWDPQPEGDDHPWNARHPVIVDTTRLQTVLNVGPADPDPLAATTQQIAWLADNAASVAAVPPRGEG
jgi:nucleoside-diphosphate-sugar epimerase